MVAHAGFGDSDCIRPLIGECSVGEVDDSHAAVLGIDGERSAIGYIGRLVENLYLALIGIYPLAEDECNGLESLHLGLGGGVCSSDGDSSFGGLEYVVGDTHFAVICLHGVALSHVVDRVLQHYEVLATLGDGLCQVDGESVGYIVLNGALCHLLASLSLYPYEAVLSACGTDELSIEGCIGLGVDGDAVQLANSGTR